MDMMKKLILAAPPAARTLPDQPAGTPALHE
jgi:hypothetical protein